MQVISEEPLSQFNILVFTHLLQGASIGVSRSHSAMMTTFKISTLLLLQGHYLTIQFECVVTESLKLMIVLPSLSPRVKSSRNFIYLILLDNLPYRSSSKAFAALVTHSIIPGGNARFFLSQASSKYLLHTQLQIHCFPALQKYYNV